MLTNNMVTAFATYIKAKESGPCPLKDYNGNYNPANYQSNLIFDSLANFGTVNSYKSQKLKSWIELGSGVTAPQKSDYVLESRYSFSNYSLDSVSVGFSDMAYSDMTYGRKIIYTTNCTWKGSNGASICEIGLFCGDTYYSANWSVFMVAREVLNTPITVNNGDVFTVSITIG